MRHKHTYTGIYIYIYQIYHARLNRTAPIRLLLDSKKSIGIMLHGRNHMQVCRFWFHAIGTNQKNSVVGSVSVCHLLTPIPISALFLNFIEIIRKYLAGLVQSRLHASDPSNTNTFLCVVRWVDYPYIALISVSKRELAKSRGKEPCSRRIPNIFEINTTNFDMLLKWCGTWYGVHHKGHSISTDSGMYDACWNNVLCG